MKRISIFLTAVLLAACLGGCGSDTSCDVAATTLPVYTFTQWLCRGTDITVSRIVTENVSCLHDYTLQVSQMRTIQSADVVVQSGAGLEEFLEDALHGTDTVIDASLGLSVQEHHDHGHVHGEDPHIWLSPENAKVMAQNICSGLAVHFPSYSKSFDANLQSLLKELDTLQAYGEQTLSALECRELVTFHDGFSYFAESFDLTILKAVEEESGSEASAAELIELANIITEHALRAVFTERNGSTAAADILAAETGTKIFSLDMAMSGEDYFSAMYHNIDTIREALG